jgi:hypothetical protein
MIIAGFHNASATPADQELRGMRMNGVTAGDVGSCRLQPVNQTVFQQEAEVAIDRWRRRRIARAQSTQQIICAQGLIGRQQVFHDGAPRRSESETARPTHRLYLLKAVLDVLSRCHPAARVSKPPVTGMGVSA